MPRPRTHQERWHTPEYISRKLAEYQRRNYLPEWIVPHLTVDQVSTLSPALLNTLSIPQLRIVNQIYDAHMTLRPSTPTPTTTPRPVQRATPTPSPRSSPTSTALSSSSTSIPEHIVNQLRELYTSLNKKFECSICMEDIEPSHIKITGCGHAYCEGCLSQLKAAARLERQWTCAVCRVKHSH